MGKRFARSVVLPVVVGGKVLNGDGSSNFTGVGSEGFCRASLNRAVRSS